jgi:hypothetical protein
VPFELAAALADLDGVTAEPRAVRNLDPAARRNLPDVGVVIRELERAGVADLSFSPLLDQIQLPDESSWWWLMLWLCSAGGRRGVGGRLGAQTPPGPVLVTPSSSPAEASRQRDAPSRCLRSTPSRPAPDRFPGLRIDCRDPCLVRGVARSTDVAIAA